MIYTVTFNPALDYVMHVGNLNAKDINRCESEKIYFGGKGINVSVILTRLGVANNALGFLAGFSGKQIESMLKEESVKTDFIYLENGFTRINVKIKSDKGFDINASGPEISEEDAAKLLDKLSVLKKGDYLVLAGSVPKSMPSDIYEKILDLFSGKGVHFVVDATGDLLRNVLKYKPFLVKPNHHELGELFSAEVEDMADIVKYSKKLQEMGAVNVLVSWGKNGAVLLDENGEVYICGNVPGEISGSVGCGDSMVAGFIAGYEEKGEYSYALKVGSACGNATAFAENLASKSEIEKMMQSEYLNVKHL